MPTPTTHRFIRIPSTSLPIAKELLAVIVDPPEAAGIMFSSAYNATGTGPATHYISSGLIEQRFADILGNAAMTFGAYQALGGQKLALADVQSLYATADIRTDANGYEQVVLDLLGMKPTDGLV